MQGLIANTSLLQPLLDFIWPPVCAGCDGFVETGKPICERCLGNIKKLKTPVCFSCFGSMRFIDNCSTCGSNSLPLFALATYSEPLVEIISGLKFNSLFPIIDPLSELIAGQFGDDLQEYESAELIPIPLHPAREYQRGYNQSALLARALSARLSIPCNEKLLLRTSKGKPHSKLKHYQREKNIFGAFEVMAKPDKKGRLILVDDVVTTGATLREAIRVLGKEGYEVSGLISIALAGGVHG